MKGKTRYCEDLGLELGIQGRWNMGLKRREDFPAGGTAFFWCVYGLELSEHVEEQ